MKIIAIMNQKGGVGKTTTAVNVAGGLLQLGRRVLLIDLDPQAHLTNGLGFEPNELDQTIYNVLKGECSLEEVTLSRPLQGQDGLIIKLVPSNLELTVAEIELSGVAGRELILREKLATVHDIDFILIDCPPSLGILTLNALAAAADVYVTMQSEYYALSGVAQLIRTIQLVKHRLNPQVDITGVIGTMYDSRVNLHKETLVKIRDFFGEKLFSVVIRKNIALAEAPSYGQTILEYAPDSNGAQDYRKLSREILRRSENG